MNKRDLQIIELLLKNARMPKVQIAQRLGLTETAIRKRIKKLEEKGIILGYRAIIDFRKLHMIQSFTGIDVDPEHLIEVITKLREMKCVISLYLTTGDHNIVAEIICKDMKELEELHEQISKVKGVRRICPAIVTEIIKT